MRRAYPLGSTKQVFAADGGKLAGMIDLFQPRSIARTRGRSRHPDRERLVHQAPFLLPGDGVRQALARFSEARLETLPVVDDPDDLQIIGYLTEAYALRRYTQELERRRGEAGEGSSLFSAATPPEAGR